MAVEAFGIKFDARGSFLSPNIKLLGLPALTLVVLLGLLLFALKTGYSKIFGQIEELESGRMTENVLEIKAETLRRIQKGILPYSETSITAMPEKNSSLWTLSQIKFLAGRHEVGMSGIEFGGASFAGGGGVTISFQLAGDVQPVIDFLKEVKALAPVMTLDDVTFESQEGNVIVVTGVTTQWADLPTELPPLTKPIVDLTSNEEELLAELAKLYLPEFTVLAPSKSGSERVDPFN